MRVGFDLSDEEENGVSEFDDRRDYRRLESEAKVVVAARGADPCLGYLTDLGMGGVGLRTPMPARVADRLELGSVVKPPPDPIGFRVVWTQSLDNEWFHHGLSYEGSVTEFLTSWVCRLFARAGGLSDKMIERRRFRRMPANLRGRVAPPGMEPGPCTVMNLGSGGLMMVSVTDFPVGQFLQISLEEPPVTVEGIVVSRRQEGNSYFASVSFDPETPLKALEALDHFLAELPGQDSGGGS